MENDNPQSTTVLIIDDETRFLKLMATRLSAWRFDVLTAQNGVEGLEVFERERPEVVVTDIAMPGIDGFEVLARIASESPETPVIVLSGKGELENAVKALRLGAWDYIYKPLNDLSLLRFSIDNALEKARLIVENRLHRENLEHLVAEKSAELAASEKRYRTVADFTYDWEYWIGPQGDVLYVSPSCERISSYSPQEIGGNPSLLVDMIHPEDRAAFNGHLDGAQHLPEFCAIDFRIRRRDGGIRWIGHQCRAVTAGEDGYQGRRCSNRDITYQKEMEQRLVAKKKTLVEQTALLERTNASLQEANTALKSLLDQRETEKRAIEQTMVSNLKRYISPYLEDLNSQRIACDPAARSRTLAIIQTNIEQLISPVSGGLSGAYLDLTPTEIKIADLIRQGASTKEIADILRTSTGTISIHRYNIRKKLGLPSKKVNLRTYLSSLA